MLNTKEVFDFARAQKLTLGNEIEQYQSEGKIKMDYMETDYNRMALKEVFKIIDEDPPDEEKFKAIKSLFLFNVEEDASEEDQLLSYQYLQVVNKLTSGEIILLKTMYDLFNDPAKRAEIFPPSNAFDMTHWFNGVAEHSGYTHGSLVELHSEKLQSLCLMRKVPFDRRPSVSKDEKLITSLGGSVCEFITKYD